MKSLCNLFGLVSLLTLSFACGYVDGNEQETESIEGAAIQFDDCCVDLRGVIDCRGKPNNPICYKFRRDGGSKSFYCSDSRKTVTCPTFEAYKCYNHGVEQRSSSIPCCSGAAAYNGSGLYCK